ncbi:MAG: hypothetical protein HYX65_11575 [Gemmatimonadetes bacterium]|nr:hypothetical protein [Gemmatimonadota bacterium]
MVQQRSLRHEYELYVESEIERYKDTIPRHALLAIGDEAVASLESQAQMGFSELLLVEEVDRIIRKRLRVPAYDTWKRRRIRQIEKFRDPQHWGLSPAAPLVRVSQQDDARVLVAGAPDESSALFLAANGCQVTALDGDEDVVERVMHAALAAGLAERVHGVVAGLESWNPEGPITGVVCSAEALAGITASERGRVIDVLKSATRDGGVHLVQTIIAGASALTLEELRRRYHGWDISVERSAGLTSSFLARKGPA